MSVASDNEARLQALDPAISCIVQAPAGSGKTELLTRRILTLLARVDQPEEILAITFTRKAASEMRQRVIGVLEDAERSLVSPADPGDAHEQQGRELALAVLKRDREQGWQLLDNPSRLQLQTIDSFCAVLTRQLPVTSSFGASLSVVEDASKLYLMAAQRCLESALASSAGDDSDNNGFSELSLLMHHLDNNLDRLQRMMADMLANRDQWLRHYQSATDSRMTMEDDLLALVDERFQILGELMPGVLAESLIPLLHHAFACTKGLGAKTDFSCFESIQDIPEASVADASFWQSLAELLLTGTGTYRKSLTKAVGFPVAKKDAETLGMAESDLRASKGEMVALLEAMDDQESFRLALREIRTLPIQGYSDEQWEVMQSLLKLLVLAVAELHLVFSEEGAVDFPEIATRASFALGALDDPSDLALALDYRIRHILVDEFQDTSESQFQLFEKLLGGWEPGDGRTFFAVGDPMQSIYRFRDAEVSLFLQAAEEGIAQLHLVSLILNSNFRSDPVIVEWCNTVFEQIFPRQADKTTGAITYSNSSPFRQSEVGADCQLHAFLGDDRKSEAAHIAQLIQAALADLDDAPKSIAILVRSKAVLTPIFAELQRVKIDYQAIDIESLGDRLVVRDILSLCRALQHPHDRLSWLSVLRAPFCGLQLTDLHALVQGHEKVPLWSLICSETQLQTLSSDGRQRIIGLREVLNSAMNRALRDGLVRWLEASWIRLGGPASCQSEADLLAADACFSVLGRIEDEGLLWDQRYINAAMSKLFAPPSTAAATVQMMTIHKSKGLEFDMVILPGLGRRPRSDISGLLNWIECRGEDSEPRLLMAPLDSSGVSETNKDPILRFVSALHKKKADNELRRLLYVAATRARRSLHLIGHAVEDESAQLRPAVAGSLLAPLWPVFESSFAQPVSRISETDEPAVIQVPLLTRIESTAVVPDFSEERFQPDSGSASSDALQTDQNEPLEFAWVGLDARLTGTLVHRQLQRIAEDGLASWSLERIEDSRSFYRSRLLTLGVSKESVDEAADRAVRAIGNMFSDDRGRWLLDDAHPTQTSEYRVTGVVDNQLVNGVIDRLFVDSSGVRWIVDFKTGDHAGAGVEAFLDAEQERYRSQLERYADVIQSMHDEPVRLGLYFPLLRGWREWEPGNP